MQDYGAAFQHVAALLQDSPDVWPVDLRFIHDQDKAVPAIKRHGLLRDLWNEALTWQEKGYGVFVNINHMDGTGEHKAPNVSAMRCAVVDLDNVNATTSYNNTTQLNPPPSFAVQSSPGKFHVYWQTQYYSDQQRFTLLQRKMRQFYDGDPGVIDPTRVLRLAGTYHLKGSPQLVYWWPLAGFNQPVTVDRLEEVFAPIILSIASGGERKPLGDESLTAPSWEWCLYALETMHPETLDRNAWRDYSYAWKQAAWLHADENTLLTTWLQWCAQYSANDQGENQKLWSSDGGSTMLGWKSLSRMNVKLKHAVAGAEHAQKKAEREVKNPAPMPAGDKDEQPAPNDAPPMPVPFPDAPKAPGKDQFGPIIDLQDMKTYFADCWFIAHRNEVFSAEWNMFLDQSRFNNIYTCGKKFMPDASGEKLANKAWDGAVLGEYQMPKVRGVRFMPHLPFGHMVEGDFDGERYVNTYKPARIHSVPGDISLFLRHMELLFPDANDRYIILKYLAHNAKYPGHKIPWAPLVQSVEGAGKKAFKILIEAMVGAVYVHQPKASDLAESGAKFNAWLERKLMIVVDEIKTPEKRDLVETLKPFISETKVEIQGKGKDQVIGDNYANWFMFTNHKDALPVEDGSRRYAIFYSPIGTKDDLARNGMDRAYFDRFYHWFNRPDEDDPGQGGVFNVVHWLHQWTIERGDIDKRAPLTTTQHLAIEYNRGPIEQLVMHAVQADQPGFRAGYVSSQAVFNAMKVDDVRKVPLQRLHSILEKLGYKPIGRCPREFKAEGMGKRSHLFHLDGNASADRFGEFQGYV